MNQQSNSDLLLTSDAARLAGVSAQTVRNWTRSGRLAIAVETPGRVRLVRAADVLRIASQRDAHRRSSGR
jgi:predicted site-specific integrase-resolvase